MLKGFAKLFNPMAYHSGYTPNYGGGQSSGAKWNNGLSSYSPVTTIDNYAARQQARAKMKDSPILRGIVSRFDECVIGTGLTVDPMPIASILGISEEEAARISGELKIQFNLFAKSKKSTISETESLNQMQSTYHFSWWRDGDVFARFMYSKEKGLISPLKIGLVDANQIRGDAITSSLGPMAQDDGIERDASGRETGYKVWFQDKNKPFKMKSQTVPAKGRSGRTHMIHSFKPEYAGQGRGFSRVFHLIQDVENIEDYQKSTVKQATNQSNVVMSVTPSLDAPATNPLEDISLDIGGATTEAFTQSVMGSIPLEFQYQALPEATLNTPGSAIIANLGPGEDLKFHGATVKGDSYGQFLDAVVDNFSPSVGMPSEVLKMKFGNNYSASRATIVLFWKVVEILREETTTDLMNPAYKAFVSEFVASGRISLPGWSDPIKKAAWLNAEWIGSPMPNIDPGKKAKADKDLLEMNSTNAERLAKEYNGSDANVNKAKNDAHFAGSELKPWQLNYGAEEEGDNNNDMDEE